MTPEQVIKFYGNERAVAEALGVTRQAVSYWVNSKKWENERIPAGVQAIIQIKTKGKLKAAL